MIIQGRLVGLLLALPVLAKAFVGGLAPSRVHARTAGASARRGPVPAAGRRLARMSAVEQVSDVIRACAVHHIPRVMSFTGTTMHPPYAR
jgi:hypothetical protein